MNATKMQNPDLNTIKGLIEEAIDLQRLEIGRKRQDSICRGQPLDYAPLILGHCQPFVGDCKENRTFIMGDHFVAGGTVVPEIEDYRHWGLAEQIASPKVMLYEGLWELLSWVRSGSDAQLSLRPRMVNVLPICFGMDYQVTDDGTMWFSKALSLDEALDADLDDLDKHSEVQLALEHLRFLGENLPEGVKTSCPIAVGPLTTADYILGKDIWLEFYDRPEKIRNLLDKITEATIRLLKLYKSIVDEPMDIARIGPLYMSCGGIKIGNDSLVMLSPEMFQEFIHPGIAKLAKVFSGAYHHSCGFYPEHLNGLCDIKEITVFNFGEPKLWDMPQAVSQLQQSGKIYYGGWERLPAEPIETYLRRGVQICGPQRNRAILHAKGEGPWPEASQTMDLWYKLQDDIYPR